MQNVLWGWVCLEIVCPATLRYNLKMKLASSCNSLVTLHNQSWYLQPKTRYSAAYLLKYQFKKNSQMDLFDVLKQHRNTSDMNCVCMMFQKPVPVYNSRYHRRSKSSGSAADMWLDHRPRGNIDTSRSSEF